MSSSSGNINNPYQKSPHSQQVYPSTIPSMEGGFIPLSFSSPNPKTFENKQGTSNNYRQSWNNFQKNRGYMQRDHNNRGGDRESPSSARKRNSGCGNDDISNYIHPSMFEDPWKALIAQNEAKKRMNEDLSDEERRSTKESDSGGTASDEDDGKTE